MVEHNLLDVLGLIEMLYLSGSRDSIMLVGDIGIGKSEGIRQLAQRLAKTLGKEYWEFSLEWKSDGEVDYRNVYKKVLEILKQPNNYFVLIDMRVSVLDPIDLEGRPMSIKLKNDVMVADYVPFLRQLIASACAGILLLDEFTCVERMEVFDAALQILLDRKMGNVRLHPDMLVVACGNKPEHTVNARALPANNVDRVLIFEVRAPNVDEWKEYMDKVYGDEWDKSTYLYLKRCERTGEVALTRPDDIETLNKFATRRGWTKFAVMLKKLKKMYEGGAITKSELMKYEEMVAMATLGREVGMKFMMFERTKVPEPEQILSEPETWLKLNDVQKYVALVNIAGWLDQGYRWDKARDWLKLLAEKDKEMLALFGKVMSSRAKGACVTWLLREKDKDKGLEKVYETIRELGETRGGMRTLRI